MFRISVFKNRFTLEEIFSGFVNVPGFVNVRIPKQKVIRIPNRLHTARTSLHSWWNGKQAVCCLDNGKKKCHQKKASGRLRQKDPLRMSKRCRGRLSIAGLLASDDGKQFKSSSEYKLIIINYRKFYQFQRWFAFLNDVGLIYVFFY